MLAIPLRPLLMADVIFSGSATAVLLLAAAVLAAPLGLPEVVLRFIGLIMIPFVAYLVWLVRRDPVPAGAAWPIVIINALWVVASILVLVAGWFEPTGLGLAFVIGQAVVVGLFAELGFFALRRRSTTAPAAL